MTEKIDLKILYGIESLLFKEVTKSPTSRFEHDE